VRKTIAEEFHGWCDYELFNRYEKLGLILKCDRLVDMEELERRLERIIQRASRYSDTPLSVGVSGVYEEKNFAAMAKEAMRALEYRRVMGGQRVFLLENFLRPAPNISVDDNMIRGLGYILHAQPIEACIGRVLQVKDSLDGSRHSLYYVATGILNALIRACDDLNGLYARYSGTGTLYQGLFEIKTEEEIFEFLIELARRIRSLNDNVITDTVDSNLRKIQLYMEAHFRDPNISFESLAKEVNFSVSYVSALMKKKLNTSFVKMLSALRIEKAKELLANPTLKIIDIAESVGYSDSYYFSHCFKKHTGISPKEFRNHAFGK